MENGRAIRTQGGFERVTRGFKKVDTGCFKSGDRMPWVETGCSRVKKDALCLWYALFSVVLVSSDPRDSEMQTVRGFSCTGVAF